MADRPVGDLTLRELFTGAEHQARELIEHLELNFAPKVKSLSKLVRNDDEDDHVPDRTVRNHAAAVLESEEYTRQLYEKLESYLQAIDTAVGRIVDESSV